MSRTYLQSVACFVCLAVWSLGISAAQAGWVTVADWQFNPGNPLVDSSGHGYTLTNNNSVTFGHDSGSGNDFAAFNGGNSLQTSTPLSLSGYSEIRVSWSMQVTTGNVGIVLETSPNYGLNPGAFVLATSANSPTTGVADVQTTAGGSVWTFTHDDGTPTPVWDNYLATFDPTQAVAANAVQVLRNGSPDSAPALPQNAVFAGFTFLDAIAYIGQRDGSSIGFTGHLANLEIQGFVVVPVPEPSSMALSLFGLVGFGGWVVRRRGHSK